MRNYRSYPEYKDSGIEWLGEIPAHWEVLRSDSVLRMVGEQVNPKQLTVETVFHYSIPTVQETGDGRVESPTEIESAKILLQGDELLVSKLNPRKGNVILTKTHIMPTVCSGEYVPMRIREHQRVTRKFTYYLYLSEYARQSISSTVQSATRSHQRAHPDTIIKLWVAFPPLLEQRAIADFLDRETAKIDALIEKKERLIKLLKEKSTALITHAVTKGLNPNVPMKDSGIEWLGRIPAHWELKRLKHILSEPLKYGANQAAELDDPELPRYVRITDIDDSDRLRDETFRSLPREVAESYLLQEGDLLLARSGATVGKTFLYRASWGECAYAGYLIRARLDLEQVLPLFIRYYTASSVYWQWLSSAFIQATIQNVSAEKYAELWVPLPTVREQEAILGFLDRETAKIDALIGKIEKAIKLLKEYRTALISAAVTGKIDVRGSAEDLELETE